jgi:hypothetical protein
LSDFLARRSSSFAPKDGISFAKKIGWACFVFRFLSPLTKSPRSFYGDFVGSSQNFHHLFVGVIITNSNSNAQQQAIQKDISEVQSALRKTETQQLPLETSFFILVVNPSNRRAKHGRR